MMSECYMCDLEWFSRIGFDGYVKKFSFSSCLFALMHFLLCFVGESVIAWFSCRVFFSLPLYSSCFCTCWDPRKKWEMVILNIRKRFLGSLRE